MLNLIAVNLAWSNETEILVPWRSEMALSRYFLPVADAIHLQDVVCHAHQCPLRLDFVQASEEELSESSPVPTDYSVVAEMVAFVTWRC